MKLSFTILSKNSFMWNSDLLLPNSILSRSVWETIMQSEIVQTLINDLEIFEFIQIKIFQKIFDPNFDPISIDFLFSKNNTSS